MIEENGDHEMGEYGKVALKARNLFVTGKASSPIEAWHKAAEDVFPDSPSCQTKGCPRGAFLGLCENGRVQNIPAGSYTRSTKNKAYAIAAAGLVTEQPNLAADTVALWAAVMNTCGESTGKAQNGQLDVVLALWNKKLLTLS